MTAVPARVAGVKEILVVCPRPEPAVMAAALEAGVTRLFRIGGAHAVAALAYGTKTVPRVDKIVGPGNQYVAAAKTLVSADCAIDFHAGPTEIVIVAARSQPEWVAADLIAQAEHDPDAFRGRAFGVSVPVYLCPSEGSSAPVQEWGWGCLTYAANYLVLGKPANPTVANGSGFNGQGFANLRGGTLSRWLERG